MSGLALLGTLLVFIAGVSSAQQVTVGAGSTLSLSDAAVDLGCSDLVVSGTLNTDSATVAQSVDVSIAAGVVSSMALSSRAAVQRHPAKGVDRIQRAGGQFPRHAH